MSGSRFDLENAKLPELLPYQNSFYENGHEAEIQALAIALFKEHIAPTMFDVNVLGNPHLGSIDLVRRSVNADGLALLSGEGEAEETRFLYRAWKGRNRNGRGLQFFRTYMQMLYPNAWRVNQLYQDQALPYGLGMLTESELSGRYGVVGGEDELVMTSRVRVSIDYNAPLATSFSEMRKILQSVLPARLTPEFSTKIDVCSDGLGIGSDTIGIAHIIDVPTPFRCGMSARSAITQTQFILKPDSPAHLGASVICHAPAFSAGHFIVRPDPMPFDSWVNWADFVAPVFGSSAIGQSSVVGSVIVRLDPMPFDAASAIGQSSVVGSVIVRLDPMPSDSWVNWADFVAPVFGSSAIGQSSVVGSVIVRLDPMPFDAASAIGQSSVVGSVIVRLDPMPFDSWANWADFVAPVEEGTVDDFYIGLVSGYASKNLPKWSHGSDSTTSVVQLINQGILPF